MKYRVTLDGERSDVEIVERAGRTFALRDGAEIPVELVDVRGGCAWSLRIGDRSIPVVASGPNDDLTLTLDAETWKARVVDEREALADAALRDGGPRAGGVVRSVMPGIVREVRVAVGAAVVRGQALVILEAMKMQNEVRADGEGTVSVVHVLAGTAVSKGDPLVTVGPPSAPGGTGAP